MGMHFGLMAATTSMDVFLDELDRYAGEFTRGGAVGSVDTWDRDPDPDGFEQGPSHRADLRCEPGPSQWAAGTAPQ
jgi:hypothetical protein